MVGINSNQKRLFNARNVGSFLIFMSCVILCCIFIFDTANDFVERVSSVQIGSVHLIAGLILLSNVISMRKMFEFIHRIEMIIEKSK